MKSGFSLFCICSLVLATGYGVQTEDFDVTGQVLLTSRGQAHQIHLLVGDRIRPMWLTDEMDCQSGDIVHVRGSVDPLSEKSPQAFISRLEVVGHEKLPATMEITDGRLDEGLYMRIVSISGIIVSVTRDDLDSQWNWITFRTRAGTWHAAVTENEYPLADLFKLKDAEVRLCGFVSKFKRWRSFLGCNLMLFGKEGVQVLSPAPDPLSVPRLSRNETSLHRRRTDGTVVGIGNDLVFLHTPDLGFLPLIPEKGSVRPHIGATIAASGFPEAGQNGIQLSETVLLETSARSDGLKRAEDVRPDQLFSDASGHDLANFNYYGRIIRIRGSVVSPPGDFSLTKTIALKFGGHQVSVDTTSLLDALPNDFGYGYEISIAGVCYAEFDLGTARHFPQFKGFAIFPRNPSDLQILGRPTRRPSMTLLAIIGILLLVIVVVIIWNRMLRTLSQRRGHELAREQLRHARAELKIEERTHLAVELHDSLSQIMTGVALQLDAAIDAMGDASGSVRKFLCTARQMVTSCHHDLKCCLWDLRSRTFEEKDMTEAIMRTIAPFAGESEVRTRFNVPREQLSESVVHTILRIVRELVVNATRHGKATRIRIAGDYRDGVIRFSVRDNGCGFDPDGVPGPINGHFGLQGIRERLAESNGSIRIESKPGSGTSIAITIAAKDYDE